MQPRIGAIAAKNRFQSLDGVIDGLIVALFLPFGSNNCRQWRASDGTCGTWVWRDFIE